MWILVEWSPFFPARFIIKRNKNRPMNTKEISNWMTKETTMYNFNLEIWALRVTIRCGYWWNDDHSSQLDSSSKIQTVTRNPWIIQLSLTTTPNKPKGDWGNHHISILMYILPSSPSSSPLPRLAFRLLCYFTEVTVNSRRFEVPRERCPTWSLGGIVGNGIVRL